VNIGISVIYELFDLLLSKITLVEEEQQLHGVVLLSASKIISQ